MPGQLSLSGRMPQPAPLDLASPTLTPHRVSRIPVRALPPVTPVKGRNAVAGLSPLSSIYSNHYISPRRHPYPSSVPGKLPRPQPSAINVLHDHANTTAWPGDPPSPPLAQATPDTPMGARTSPTPTSTGGNPPGTHCSSSPSMPQFPFPGACAKARGPNRHPRAQLAPSPACPGCRPSGRRVSPTPGQVWAERAEPGGGYSQLLGATASQWGTWWAARRQTLQTLIPRQQWGAAPPRSPQPGS